jgi:hypothetical protein
MTLMRANVKWPDGVKAVDVLDHAVFATIGPDSGASLTFT